jgi:hypothetical protein
MRATLLLTAAGTLLAGSLAAQSDFDLRRELGAGARFTLRNIIGDVTVEPASGRTVEVRGVKREGRHGDPEDVEIRAVEDGRDGVTICVFYPGSGRWRDRDDDRNDRDRARRRSSDPCSRDGGGWSHDRNDTRVDFTVALPADLDVDIKTVSGDVIGRGLRGTLDLATVSGDLRLSDLKATTLEASSVSGDVELDGVEAREVTAETVSGDVVYVGRVQREGSYYFKTLSGDVELTIPEQPDATLRGSTFSGRLDSDFPTSTNDRRRRNRFSATWGSGSATIDVESFSGDVRIRRATR